MRKDVDTFHANKDYKLAIVTFIPTLALPKIKHVAHFSNAFYRKTWRFNPSSFT